jgi:hypothetical protein
MIKILFSYLIVAGLIFSSCQKDRQNEDINLNNNVIFKGLDNNIYEFKNYAENNRGILLFGFATWCGNSRKEFKNIFKIDSLFSKRLAIVGLDCSNKDDTIKIRQFIELNKISFPVTKIFWNADFDKLLFPDTVYKLPTIVYLDKRLNKVYSQIGFLTSTVDSIKKYMK